MSTDALAQIFLLVFYLTLILLELNLPMKITFMEWLEVPTLVTIAVRIAK